MYCFPFPSYKFLDYSWGWTMRKFMMWFQYVAICELSHFFMIMINFLNATMTSAFHSRWGRGTPLEKLSVNTYSNGGDSSSVSEEYSFFRFFLLSIRDVLILFACWLYKLFSLWCCIIPLIGLPYGCFLFTGIWSPYFFVHTGWTKIKQANFKTPPFRWI